MAKVINAYRTYTASVINSRMSDTCDHTVVGSTVECTNIKMSKVKNVLGAATYSLYELCRHANVNHWSAFGPTVRGSSGSGRSKVMTNSDPTVCSLGSFAGYNHSAPLPGWQTGGEAAAEADIWVNSGSKATVSANVSLGEVDYTGAAGVAMLIFDSYDNIVGWGQQALSGLGNNFILYGETDANITLDKSYHAMGYVIDTYPLAQSEDVESAVVCQIPLLTEWDVNIKVKAASEWHYSGDGQTIPSPWVQNGSAGMNWNTGYFDIGSIATNNNYGSSFRIVATLYDWSNDVIGSDEIYSGAYTALDDITGSVYLGMATIPAYGYSVVVEFLY